ncbi:hypothetical protein BC2230_50262 [Burkholderia cepacia]
MPDRHAQKNNARKHGFQNLKAEHIIVDAGANINIRGDLNNTPLHKTTLYGPIHAVELLLSLS